MFRMKFIGLGLLVFFNNVNAVLLEGQIIDDSTHDFIGPFPPEVCDDGLITATHYSYGFENGLNGWDTDALVGWNTWVQSSVSTHTGLKSMLVTDINQIGDQILTSPVISLPENQAPLTLQFWHQQFIEAGTTVCYDGAILEISTNNGQSFIQISDDKMLSNPYDGPIAISEGNPLATRDAWCGDPQDWFNSIVDLNTYEGQNVVFRFRLGTDNSVDREGWYIDDVKIQSCVLLENDIIFLGGFEELLNKT